VPNLRFLIEPSPQEVEAVRRTAFETAQALAAEGNVAGAFESIAAAYRTTIQLQPRRKRFHKGWLLHQMGLLRLQQQMDADARAFFLLAFVEDALTRGEGSPDRIDEINAPAALNLIYGFALSGSQILDLAVRLRKRQSSGRFFATPEAALKAVPLEPAVSASSLATKTATEIELVRPAREPEWRRVSDFGVPWEDRVFVGGRYDTHFATLRVIRDEIRRNGLDGVLVAEFKGGRGMTTRNKSLTLLKACRRAVFELSKAGGQLVEFDRVLDFEIDEVLVVYRRGEDKVEISSMSSSLFGRISVQLSDYKDTAGLQTVVRTWLRKRRRRLRST
jgi:hypothetical protein